MGSYWSYEEVTKEVGEEKKNIKECDKVENLLKDEINRYDIMEELKNNALFNERRNRSKTPN